jgi:two-component system response regulator HydG
MDDRTNGRRSAGPDADGRRAMNDRGSVIDREDELGGLLGRCPAMVELRRQIVRFGPTDLSIHVYGETGTGKERVARALHSQSERRRRPFVAFNAAGFSDELVEAELFGHARGAFTGAVVEREGFVAAAEGGTLFLDEVAELTLRAQAKLLRFLQEREYRRVGETASRRADVRVLTAANVDLFARVREGTFRKDLWYRLKDVRLTAPPLRERGADVLLLARHALGAAARRQGRHPPALAPEVARVLARFPWPGNVRQLESEMRRLVVAADGGRVEVGHLSDEIRDAPPAATGCLRAAVQAFERDYLRRVLERHGGVRTRAAAELGITRQALVAKIRRLGVLAEGSASGMLSSRAGVGWRVGRDS